MNFDQFDYLTGCLPCEVASALVDLKAMFFENTCIEGAEYDCAKPIQLRL